MKSEILLFSPGRAMLGIIVPILTDLSLRFDLATYKQSQFEALSNGIYLNTENTSRHIPLNVIYSPKLDQYKTIIMSVGYYSIQNVYYKIRKSAPDARIILAENVLYNEIEHYENIQVMINDRIVSRRSFENNCARVWSESFLSVKSPISLFVGHKSHELISEENVKVALLNKFLNVNLPHKIAAMIAFKYGYRSINEYFLFEGVWEFKNILNATLSYKSIEWSFSEVKKFVARLKMIASDDVGRVTNSKGNSLFTKRLKLLEIPTTPLLSYL